MKKVIVFDYDGTLHETMRIYRPAIAWIVRWLRETCHKDVELPSDARISSWLGMNTADMWRSFMPELDPELRQKAGRLVGDQMLLNLRNGLGRWYPGVETMLDELKDAGYTLAVLSNCGNAYAKAHWDTFQMDRWFTVYFTCETWNGAPKDVIMREIAGDFDAALERSPVKCVPADTLSDCAAGQRAPGKPPAGSGERSSAGAEAERSGQDAAEWQIAAAVGDRDSDLSGAQAVCVPFIGCLYGYGSREELAESTAFAQAPSDIAARIRELGLSH